MKKKTGIPPYNDPADGPLTPEQIAENVRMSVDSLAALNVALEMDMSAAEAFAFVQKNRDKFEEVANAIAGDQSIADTARTIKALSTLSARKAGKSNHGRPKRTSRFEKEYAAWEKCAKDVLVANGFAKKADLDVKAIADAIKRYTKTKRTDVGLRKWVKEHEANLRENAKEVIDRASKRQEVTMRANAKEGRRRTLKGL